MSAREALDRLLAARERTLAALLVAGAAFLAVELRFEHREALGETWHAWIPLSYSAATVLVGPFALLGWERGGRKVLLAIFAGGLAVGLAGVLFHAGGHPARAIGEVLAAWTLAPGQAGNATPGHPPALAPLAFAGWAALGIVACAEPRAVRGGLHFDRRSPRTGA